MKRLLYGTTALVAAGTLMTGPAYAAGLEASLNGYMEQWFGFSDNDEDTTDGPAGVGAEFTETNFTSDTEVHFNATATLDNGLKVQYHVELEGNTDSDQIDESYLQLTANWGQVVFGSENSAMYKMGYGPTQMGITTLSGDSTSWINQAGQGGGAGRFRTPWGSANQEVDASCNDDKRLTYFTPRFSGFQFGGSYTANCGSQDTNALGTDATIEHTLSFGANFNRKFDQVKVQVSAIYGRGEKPSGNTGDDPEVFGIGTNIGFGGFTLGGYYSDTIDAIHNAAGTLDNDNTGYSVGLSYANGPWGVSFHWSYGEREGLIADPDEDEVNRFELGGQYKLGPGVELRGSIFYVDAEAETDSGEFDNDGWAVIGGMKVSF